MSKVKRFKKRYQGVWEAFQVKGCKLRYLDGWPRGREEDKKMQEIYWQLELEKMARVGGGRINGELEVAEESLRVAWEFGVVECFMK